MLSVGIIGATGYTGGELLRILAHHPDVEVKLVTSETYAGQQVRQHFPGLIRYQNLKFIRLNIENLPGLDCFFLCLPHGKSMNAVKMLARRQTRLIDLSADFRLNSVKEYENWYQQTHIAPELCEAAVYGLPEIFGNQISNAQIVANPGCYPTSILLPLIPLLQAELPIAPEIIVDSKSGVSGAGRNPGLIGQFAVVNENFSAYKIGHRHRHVGEMEEKLNMFTKNSCRITFSPHLLPVSRGILSTIYLTLHQPVSQTDMLDVLNYSYEQAPFVRILETGELPQLTAVRHTNRCDIGVHCFNENRNAIIVACIDNLTKGASGQAVQNMNLMFGFTETSGLSSEGATC